MRLINPDDTEALAEELLSYDEVRKVNITGDMIAERFKAGGKDGVAVIYSDFEETENISVDEGRFPKHDNEIMISKIF